MYHYLIAIVVIVLIAVVPALAQAAPGWLVPPGGTIPPEPQPVETPGAIESALCSDTQTIVLYPRWFLPIVVTP